MLIHRRRRTTVTAVGSVVAAAALILSAQSAMAGTTYRTYSVTAPVAQMPASTSAQVKSTTARSGYSITFVGASYSVDVAMCRLPGLQCGNKVKGLKKGDYGFKLTNAIPAGTKVYASNWISSWNAVKVTVTGGWRSN